MRWKRTGLERVIIQSSAKPLDHFVILYLVRPLSFVFLVISLLYLSKAGYTLGITFYRNIWTWLELGNDISRFMLCWTMVVLSFNKHVARFSAE